MKKTPIIGTIFITLFIITSCKTIKIDQKGNQIQQTKTQIKTRTQQTKTRTQQTKTRTQQTKTRTQQTRKQSTSVQCSGTTQKGNRCKRKTLSSSGRCYQH